MQRLCVTDPGPCDSTDLDALESDSGFEIIGSSPAFVRVLNQVEIVAPTNSAVLLQGETGTGKEVIARAIHDHSRRRNAAFVKLNCAAIPTGLLESELFGHERGAFTGAVTSQAGRFQLADRGTLFLDEIGELPLELQPKLLRVLQERELQRLGSPHSIRIDVRVIAASNQDLLQMVQERRFRADLYYRLNVFPIDLPPLRARREDIPGLVRHFVRKFSREMGRQIETIPPAVMEVLKLHDWPGNIRELQNFVERAVILSRGAVFCPPLNDLRPLSAEASLVTTRTLAQAEREHIVAVLRETGGVMGGPQGAAARRGRVLSHGGPRARLSRGPAHGGPRRME